MGKVFLLAAGVFCLGASAGHSDDVSLDTQFARKLTAPFTSVLKGKSFRDSLHAISRQAELNLWIDRMIDPTSNVDPGNVGPTVIAAMRTVAAERGCVVFPVANVVLVGRESWVDQTAASILSISSGRSDSTTVEWSDLTTPSEAWQAIDGKPNENLPHDLWPATELKAIDKRVAAALILAQFDLRPVDVKMEKYAPATEDGRFTRTYSKPDSLEDLRDLAKRSGGASIKASSTKVRIEGSVRVHRLLAEQLIRANPAVGSGDTSEKRFSLNLKAKAGDALKQFAQAAGWEIEIRRSAEEKCQSIVTLKAENKTLAELVQLVAAEAKVNASMNGQTLIIGQR